MLTVRSVAVTAAQGIPSHNSDRLRMTPDLVMAPGWQ